jgi:prepilin-type N-terminal cleavage/methylation domain-containing protein/prepilin-type processing-associated H-X9-DG protein
VRRSANAFTLVELLVVIAIVSALAALLFPLMSGVKASAQRAVCLSQMRQVVGATTLYTSDYDDTFMPISYQPSTESNSRNDRTWVQLVLPYIRNFSVFKCPSDNSSDEDLTVTFDQDLVPGDTASQYYRASLRTNLGFNYQYLSPIQKTGGRWTARPRTLSEIGNPSTTLMYLDSVWGRTEGGSPVGGGSWLVTPPCRFYLEPGNVRSDSFTGGRAFQAPEVFTVSTGWSVGEESAPTIYGNAWPWHSGRMNMAQIDGSVRSILPSELSDGCDLKDAWQGTITNAGDYLWDLR